MSEGSLRALIAQHRSAGVVVDANLLLLYCVGLCDATLIERFKRTLAYRQADFRLLQAFLRQFQRQVTTPSILTEVNSLANQLPDKNKPKFYSTFQAQIALLDEHYQPSQEVCRHPYFARCGLSDTAILTISQGGLLVLTDDFKLAGLLAARSIACLNFNHIRSWPA